MKVLVVDDSPVIRNRLVAMLREVPGVELREAGDPDEALDTIRAYRPDLVVLDVHLPGRTGIELLPLIKALLSPPEVVILTGHPTEHHRRLSMANGADFFFDKSRDFARVVELVTIRAILSA